MNQPVTVLVISDALGETAASVALAAAGQFDEGTVTIERLSRVQDARQVKSYLEPFLSLNSITSKNTHNGYPSSM